MKLKTILTLIVVLLLSVSVADAQNRHDSKSKTSTEKGKDDKSSSKFKGSESSKFESWVKAQVKDELKRLKKMGVKNSGNIEVNYEVEPKGNVIPGSFYQTDARGEKGVDGKINDAIFDVLTDQKWDISGWKSNKSYRFILSY